MRLLRLAAVLQREIKKMTIRVTRHVITYFFYL